MNNAQMPQYQQMLQYQQMPQQYQPVQQGSIVFAVLSLIFGILNLIKVVCQLIWADDLQDCFEYSIHSYLLVSNSIVTLFLILAVVFGMIALIRRRGSIMAVLGIVFSAIAPSLIYLGIIIYQWLNYVMD